VSLSLAAFCHGRYKPPRSNRETSLAVNLSMAIERTFSILKPDATERNLTGAINAMIEQAGLRIIAQRRVRISREQAETFYGVHRARPFYGELVEFMTSGPVVVQVLEGDNAIARYRDIMGATDPAKAAPGTIRKVHARSIGENSVHGSDAPETAAREIAQFFAGNEIVG
jgi:nucleoside-diphosphate kinase